MNYFHYTYGFKYLIYFQYLVEDRQTPEFHLRYKHSIRFNIFTIRIFTLIVRSYSAGSIWIKDKEIYPTI